jgi:membrane protein DedA with SNARE-associated domain
MMEQLTALLVQYGLMVVFANVFLEQAGVPVPAVPTLLVAGALAAGGGPSLAAIIGVAVLGSLLGDIIWYVAGRIYGMRVLQLLCRISISPDSCVRETETRFMRWGPVSLIIAKFVPGFSTVAPPLAGALRIKCSRFLFYSALGAALWAGLAAVAGTLFHRQIDWLLAKLGEMGIYALIVVAVALALFVAVKWRERRRFFKALRMARISVDDLYRLMQEGAEPVVVDVRSPSAREIDPRRVPGAIPIDVHNLDAELARVPPDRDIIVYCT